MIYHWLHLAIRLAKIIAGIMPIFLCLATWGNADAASASILRLERRPPLMRRSLPTMIIDCNSPSVDCDAALISACKQLS